METKQEIFNTHKERYFKAHKALKSEILTYVSAVTRMHRKACVRKFRKLQIKDPLRNDGRGRETYYTPDVTAALKDIWEAGNEVCGELLHSVLKEYVDILLRDDMWGHGDEATAKLRVMSEATMKRRVGTFMKARRKKKGISSTKPSHIKHLIPIFMGPWEGMPPGYGQIDTVRHSTSASGDALHTTNYTDAATLAVIPRAQWNKGETETLRSIENIRSRMFSPLLGLHPDTGGEFVNYKVLAWCEKEGIHISRSRPNHKNDNMYVEERNGHVVRKEVGYITLDCREAVDALNNFYDILTPYLFHFVAVRRMIEKEKLSSRYRRVYEKRAMTPYQRMLDHTTVSPETKARLRQEHATLNPLVLKKEMERRMKKVYDVQKRYGNPKS